MRARLPVEDNTIGIHTKFDEGHSWTVSVDIRDVKDDEPTEPYTVQIQVNASTTKKDVMMLLQGKVKEKPDDKNETPLDKFYADQIP